MFQWRKMCPFRLAKILAKNIDVMTLILVNTRPNNASCKLTDSLTHSHNPNLVMLLQLKIHTSVKSALFTLIFSMFNPIQLRLLRFRAKTSLK